MFCQNPIPNCPRHSLCKCHLRLQDILHSFYKDLEAKVGKTLETSKAILIFIIIINYYFYTCGVETNIVRTLFLFLSLLVQQPSIFTLNY